MCGVCGIVATNAGFRAGAEIASAMRDSMLHRGPDDGGVWCSPDRRVALAHRRLSIVDLSAAGKQPMCNEDGTVWITYNGEVYNHSVLRAELEAKGHVLPVAHRHRDDRPPLRRGGRALRRASARNVRLRHLGRSRRRELFLARDRLGVKPLYYATPPGGFVFGSEIKALLRASGDIAGPGRGGVHALPHLPDYAGAAHDVSSVSASWRRPSG